MRPLAFGLLLMFAATIGQTLVISLFLPGIKADFGLGDAQVALLFTLTTLASAAAVWKIGAWLDRADTLRYSLACGALLLLATLVIALGHSLAVLVVGMFCLRLAGNGLLTHVALTATARHFTRNRGRALSLILLGSSVGEGGFPAPLVALIAAWGWRPALATVGLFGLMLVFIAAFLIRTQATFRAPAALARATGSDTPRRMSRAAQGDSRRYFALTSLLFVGMPMIVTATVFHQALVAEAKGVSLQWFAVSFVAFAVLRVVSSLVTGPVVDRTGSERLFRLHLVPLVAGTAVLIVFDSPWVAPVYWSCAGISSGMWNVLCMTVVAERVALSRLGAARSIVGAAGIIASAVGPSFYGAGLALGATVEAILWAAIAFLVAATVLGFFASPRTVPPEVRSR